MRSDHASDEIPSSHRDLVGYIYPVAQRARETRVICRIHSRRITLDAIHA